MVSGFSASHTGLTSLMFSRVSGRSQEYKIEMEKRRKKSWKGRGERSWPSRRLGMETVGSIKLQWYTLLSCTGTGVPAMDAESQWDHGNQWGFQWEWQNPHPLHWPQHSSQPPVMALLSAPTGHLEGLQITQITVSQTSPLEYQHFCQTAMNISELSWWNLPHHCCVTLTNAA